MNLVLIGLRACGKSSISRHLAQLSKRPVLSTDLLISYEQGGRSIADIVAACQGDWRPFREMEYEVARKVAALDDIIIDTGGGMVVDWDDQEQEIFSERKVSLLKRNGLLIWLHGEVERLAAKVQGDPSRPTLSDRLSVEELMRRRLPFYQQAADWVVDIEGKTRKELAREIMNRISVQ
ncbi:MAG: shikimate kinase [Magnetococcales bacterium]|nr:shikimate kinase [Magnetococcales bacterium]